MSSGPQGSKVVIGCFFVVWCMITFGMGITALESGAPFIFALVPFGMGVFGIVFCIAIITGRLGTSPITTPRMSFPSYTGDSSFSSSARDRKAIYQAPNICSSCGASISTEDVDWVGPLQLKCPYCGFIMEAEEKRF